MSVTLNCPACGAGVTFKSSASVFMVCPYCRSMLVRHDQNLDSLGKMADLQGDMTPLQVGVRGKFDKKSFELIGRLRIAWSDGSWNEWCARFDDGREGWLAEAQGNYAMSFAAPCKALSTATNIQIGQTLEVAGKQFAVTDIKAAQCVGSEGELPFRAPRGRQSTSIDLTGDDGVFASLEFAPSEEPRAYVGSYIDFDAMHLSGLKAIDGW